MLARKLILGFGFTLVVPLLIHFGIDAVHGSLDTRSYYAEAGRLRQREEQARGEEKERLVRERERFEDEHRAAERASSKVHFFVGAPLGIAVTLAGSLVTAPAIGGGLMLGGIFTFTDGCFWYWGDLDPTGRFVVLLVAFAVLVWIGWQRLAELQTTRNE